MDQRLAIEHLRVGGRRDTWEHLRQGQAQTLHPRETLFALYPLYMLSSKYKVKKRYEASKSGIKISSLQSYW